MTKHRLQPKSKGQPLGGPGGPGGNDKARRQVVAATGRPSLPPTPAASPAAPTRRSTYFEAVALYERGLEALQRHDYRTAIDQLESVLRQYPDEKELHERVRLYLNICRRQAVPRESAPQTLDEKL